MRNTYQDLGEQLDYLDKFHIVKCFLVRYSYKQFGFIVTMVQVNITNNQMKTGNNRVNRYFEAMRHSYIVQLSNLQPKKLKDMLMEV